MTDHAGPVSPITGPAPIRHPIIRQKEPTMATDTTQIVAIDDVPEMLKTARADLEKVIADLRAVLPVRDWREEGEPYAAVIFADGAANRAEVTAKRLETLMLPMIDEAIRNAGLAFDAVDEVRHRRQHDEGDCSCEAFGKAGA